VGLSRLGSSDDHQTPGNSQTSGNSQWGDNPNSARRLVGLFDRSVSVRHNTVRFSLTYPDVRSDCQQLSAGSRGVIPRAGRSDTPQVTGRTPLNPTENPAESPLNPTHPFAITIWSTRGHHSQTHPIRPTQSKSEQLHPTHPNSDTTNAIFTRRHLNRFCHCGRTLVSNVVSIFRGSRGGSQTRPQAPRLISNMAPAVGTTSARPEPGVALLGPGVLIFPSSSASPWPWAARARAPSH